MPQATLNHTHWFYFAEDKEVLELRDRIYIVYQELEKLEITDEDRSKNMFQKLEKTTQDALERSIRDGKLSTGKVGFLGPLFITDTVT